MLGRIGNNPKTRMFAGVLAVDSGESEPLSVKSDCTAFFCLKEAPKRERARACAHARTRVKKAICLHSLKIVEASPASSSIADDLFRTWIQPRKRAEWQVNFAIHDHSTRLLLKPLEPCPQ